ncbi:MAG: hypothetical protein P4L40_02645 [Terracidiphilus sp.]|nr:hypothetical protein [Terracidiphilus sp.]
MTSRDVDVLKCAGLSFANVLVLSVKGSPQHGGRGFSSEPEPAVAAAEAAPEPAGDPSPTRRDLFAASRGGAPATASSGSFGSRRPLTVKSATPRALLTVITDEAPGAAESPVHTPAVSRTPSEFIDVATAAAQVVCDVDAVSKLSQDALACVLSSIRASLREDVTEPSVALLACCPQLPNALWQLLRRLNPLSPCPAPAGETGEPAKAQDDTSAKASPFPSPADSVSSPSRIRHSYRHRDDDVAPSVPLSMSRLSSSLSVLSGSPAARNRTKPATPSAKPAVPPPETGVSGVSDVELWGVDADVAVDTSDSDTTVGSEASHLSDGEFPEPVLSLAHPARSRAQIQDADVRTHNGLLCVECLCLIHCAGVSPLWLHRLLTLVHPARLVPNSWRFQTMAGLTTMAISASSRARMRCSPPVYFTFPRPQPVGEHMTQPPQAETAAALTFRNVTWPFAREYCLWLPVRVRSFGTLPASAQASPVGGTLITSSRNAVKSPGPVTRASVVTFKSTDSSGMLFDVYVMPGKVVLRCEPAAGVWTELEAFSERIMPGRWFNLGIQHTK